MRDYNMCKVVLSLLNYVVNIPVTNIEQRRGKTISSHTTPSSSITSPSPSNESEALAEPTTGVNGR